MLRTKITKIGFGMIICASNSGCIDKISLRPPPVSTIRAVRVNGAEEFYIESASGAVQVWKAKSLHMDQSTVLVLQFGGNGSVAEDVIEKAVLQWRNQPVEIWAVNYPGFGRSAGTTSLKSLVPAMLAVFDEARKQAAGRPIVLECWCLGCSVGAAVGQLRDVDGYIFRDPLPIFEYIDTRYGWWSFGLIPAISHSQIPRELDSILTVRRLFSPAVFTTTVGYAEAFPDVALLFEASYAGPKRHLTVAALKHEWSVGLQQQDEFQYYLRWLIQRVTSGG